MHRLIGFRSLVVLAAACLLACSQQAEGDRCDPLNGDDDCESGLTCQAIEGRGADGRPLNLCCPADPRLITESACIPGQPSVDAGSGAPDAAADSGDEDAADAQADSEQGADGT